MAALTQIVNYCAAAKAEDAQQKAAEQYLDAHVRLYQQAKQHVAELAGLSARWGRANLLARVPAEVATASRETTTLLAQMWGALSDDPFPELPEVAAAEEGTPGT